MPSTTYHASDFLRAAERIGVPVTVGTDGSQAFQELVPGSTITLDFDDLAGAGDEVAAFHRRFPIGAVVAADDETATLAATVAENLGLAHNPVEAVLPTRSKLSLRRVLNDAGLPSPRYQVIDLGPGFTSRDAEERTSRVKTAVRKALNDALDSNGISFPCVLKPTFLSASRGVIRADDADGFRRAARRIAAILHEESEAGGGSAESHLILVEDYVPGAEYALEAMLTEGSLHLLAIFDKPDPLEGPYFEETIYVTPSRATETTQGEIVATVEQAVAALGLREGPIHAELRLNERGAHIVDLAARAIGGLCSRVLRFGTGCVPRGAHLAPRDRRGLRVVPARRASRWRDDDPDPDGRHAARRTRDR